MRIIALVALVACHAAPRATPPPAPQRVATAIAAWGSALASGDEQRLAAATDGGGQLAFIYVAIKTAANRTPGGAEAVEYTALGIIVFAVLGALSSDDAVSGEGGYPFDQFLLFIPAGSISRALVASGLAYSTGPRAADRPELVAVPVSWQQTFGRLEQQAAEHRARLVARQAWTCRPTAIERTVPASEPSLVRAAALSHTFADWLRDVDAIWLVRARCANGAGVFVVAGHVVQGRAQDRVLVAHVGR